MDSTEEKVHIVACPAARRALRQNNPRVMWCLKHIALYLDNDIKFSDTRKPGFDSPGCTSRDEDVLNFAKSFDPLFTVTTARSRLYNNEVVKLISQGFCSLKGNNIEFELLLKRCKPIPLV